MTTRFIPAAIAALTLLAGPALAQNDDPTPQRAAVSYADLNLNTETGQAILATRIHRAAETVCGPEPDSRDLRRQAPYRQCLKQSVEAAVAAIPTPSQMAGGAKPAG
ncbi:MAG TPA: UrcA family protein [Caulobacteraceae bacterium]|jgi:UrcA family protein